LQKLVLLALNIYINIYNCSSRGAIISQLLIMKEHS
jgi:hypothetical protein